MITKIISIAMAMILAFSSSASLQSLVHLNDTSNTKTSKSAEDTEIASIIGTWNGIKFISDDGNTVLPKGNTVVEFYEDGTGYLSAFNNPYTFSWNVNDAYRERYSSVSFGINVYGSDNSESLNTAFLMSDTGVFMWAVNETSFILLKKVPDPIVGSWKGFKYIDSEENEISLTNGDFYTVIYEDGTGIHYFGSDLPNLELTWNDGVVLENDSLGEYVRYNVTFQNEDAYGESTMIIVNDFTDLLTELLDSGTTIFWQREENPLVGKWNGTRLFSDSSISLEKGYVTFEADEEGFGTLTVGDTIVDVIWEEYILSNEEKAEYESERLYLITSSLGEDMLFSIDADGTAYYCITDDSMVVLEKE